MSFRRMLTKINPSRGGLVPRMAEAAEYFGVSVATGYLQNRYREKASLFGVPAELVGGVGMKALALVLDMRGKGHGTLGSQANILGNIGLAAYGHTIGAGLGASASGVKRVLVQAQDLPRVKAAVPGATVLGDIPPAPHGDLLSTAELREMIRGD